MEKTKEENPFTDPDVHTLIHDTNYSLNSIMVCLQIIKLKGTEGFLLEQAIKLDDIGAAVKLTENHIDKYFKTLKLKLEQSSLHLQRIKELEEENKELKNKIKNPTGKPERKCPKCGSSDIIMFTSDLDICECGQLLNGE